MHMTTRSKLLLILGCLAGICSNGNAQAISESAPNSLSVAITYRETMANAVGGYGFWMQGGSAQLVDRPWRRLEIVADFAGQHAGATHDPNLGLDLVTMTFGPRYTWSPVGTRVSIFGESLVGEALGLHSLFPSATGASPSSHSLALQLGGGINLPVSRRLSIRAFEADWLRTQLPNATTGVQNSLRLGAGIAYRIK